MRAARQAASLFHRTRVRPPGCTFFCACRHRLDRCSLSAQRRVHLWLSRIYSISPHCLHPAGRHIPGSLPPPQAAHRHPHQHWLTHPHEHTVSRDELTPGGGNAAAEPLLGEGPPQEGLDPAGVWHGGGGGVYSRYIDSCPTGSGSGAASTRAGGIRSCGELVFLKTSFQDDLFLGYRFKQTPKVFCISAIMAQSESSLLWGALALIPTICRDMSAQ